MMYGKMKPGMADKKKKELAPGEKYYGQYEKMAPKKAMKKMDKPMAKVKAKKKK